MFNNKLNAKLSILFRFLIVEAFLLTLFPVELPKPVAAAPAASLASTAAAPAAAGPVTIRLQVVSARTETRWPGNQPGGVLQNAAIPNYKFIINEDNAGDPTQARNAGCAPGFSANGKSYPDTCDWPSIHAAQGASPIVTQGDQSILNDGIL